MAMTANKTTNAAAERMQCMEVWGGNSEVDRDFEMPGLKTWVYSRPFDKSASGGDVYYISSCASGRITRIILADVSGHGAAASKVGVALRDLMSRNVNRIKQTRFVQDMNRQFAEVAEDNCFATAIVSTFFAPTRSFTMCNAGHPPPFLYRNIERRWIVLEKSLAKHSGFADMPLGVLDQTEYQQIEVRLDPGDLILCFSDALTESLDEKGNLLGQSGLLSLLDESDVSDPSQILTQLRQRILSKHASNLENDDVTAILLEVTARGSMMRDNLLAPFRLLKPVRDNTEMR